MDKCMKIENRQKLKYVLVIALYVISVLGIYAQAEEGIVFRVENQSGKEGELVTVPVVLQSGGEAGGFDIKVYYDAEVLEFQELQKGDLIREDGLFDYNHKAEEASVKIIYVVADTVEANGTIANLTFRLKKDCGTQLPLGVGIEEVIDNSEDGNLIGGIVEGTDDAFQKYVEQNVSDKTELNIAEDIEYPEESNEPEEKEKITEPDETDKATPEKKKEERKEEKNRGIGVIAAAGVVILAAIAVLMYRRKKI